MKTAVGTFCTETVQFNVTEVTKGIADPMSAYRQSLDTFGPFVMVWIALCISFVCMNCYALMVPNFGLLAIAVKQLLDEDKSEAATYWWFWVPVAVAFYEMLGFSALLLRLTHSIYMSRGPSCFKKWDHVGKICFAWLPELSRFSAVRFLGKTHYVFLVPEFQSKMELEWSLELAKRLTKRSKGLFLLRAVGWWVVMKLVILTGGVLAFCSKVISTSHVLLDEVDDHGEEIILVRRIIVLLAFVNQALNMVNVSKRLFDRALSFAFAGEDAILQSSEYMLMKVFRATVAQRIFEEARNRPYALAVLFAFDHSDVQRLVTGSVTARRENPAGS